MKSNLIIVVAIAVILIGFTVNKARGWGGLEAKVVPGEFDIEMKALTGADIAKLYPGVVDYKDNKLLPRKVYIFGRVLSDADRSAIIVIDIKCKQVPYLEEKDITIGWIGPRRSSPVFFLVGFSSDIDNEDIHNFEMTYKIKKVFKK